VETAIRWMKDNDIVERVLRSNLHHKQYVDQVGTGQEAVAALSHWSSSEWLAAERPRCAVPCISSPVNGEV